MSIKQLNCNNLGDLDDGRARLIIDKMFDEAIKDLEDRGTDEKPRTITIKIELTQTREDRFAAHVEAGLKRPGFRTADHAAVLRKKPGGSREPSLFFQEFSSEDAGQQDLRDHLPPHDPESGEIH